VSTAVTGRRVGSRGEIAPAEFVESMPGSRSHLLTLIVGAAIG
jgi:hypothetical protein